MFINYLALQGKYKENRAWFWSNEGEWVKAIKNGIAFELALGNYFQYNYLLMNTKKVFWEECGIKQICIPFIKCSAMLFFH